MPLRKLVPLIGAALTLAACSSGSITGPSDTRAVPPRRGSGFGMLGGSGALVPAPEPVSSTLPSGWGMLGGSGKS
jgi:hypothetical protein